MALKQHSILCILFVGIFNKHYRFDVLHKHDDTSSIHTLPFHQQDEILNWTIPAWALGLGATYNITLQTLPQSVSEPNSRFKIVTIPTPQGTF